MEQELVFLGLLGFEVIPENEYFSSVVDDQGKQVGTLKYRYITDKLGIKTDMRVCSISIDNGTVFYTNKVVEDMVHDKCFEFAVLNNGYKHIVKMNLSTNPSLEIYRNNILEAKMSLVNNIFKLHYTLESGNNDIVYSTVFDSSENLVREYEYGIEVFTNSKGKMTKSFKIRGTQGSYGDRNELCVSEFYCRNDKWEYPDKIWCDASLRDMIVMHELGINDVEIFNGRLKEFLPFREDIDPYEVLFQNAVLPKNELRLLLPDVYQKYYDCGPNKNLVHD